MGDFKLQYESKLEHCKYCYDEINKVWVKVTIERATEFPADVKEQMERDKEQSNFVLEALKHK